MLHRCLLMNDHSHIDYLKRCTSSIALVIAIDDHHWSHSDEQWTCGSISVLCDLIYRIVDTTAYHFLDLNRDFHRRDCNFLCLSQNKQHLQSYHLLIHENWSCWLRSAIREIVAWIEPLVSSDHLAACWDSQWLNSWPTPPRIYSFCSSSVFAEPDMLWTSTMFFIFKMYSSIDSDPFFNICSCNQSCRSLT